MKIAFTGLKLPEGKTKYQDPVVIGLTEKFEPKKVSPYFFEFLPDGYEDAEAIVITEDNVLDLLILDIEKLEGRIERAEDDAEKGLIKKCQAQLENEKPVCDMEMTDEEREVLNNLNLVSFKPTLVIKDKDIDIHKLCEQIMEKSNTMFFYTAGKQEVHAWFVDKGSDAVTCAGKIHTDLARGFIKADVVSYEDMLKAHNMKDAISQGLAKLVDKDYIIEPNTVLEIRFNV